MNPDAIIEVRFATTKEGGRQSPVSGSYFGCVFVVDGEAFDCRLLLSGRQLELGVCYEVPVAFLNPQLVVPKLALAKAFVLWEGKDIAIGNVVRVVRNQA